jgi:serine/threonine protein kinase, bacterial
VAPATPTTGAPPGDATTEHLGGRCVGNSYILIRPIGHGATGTVWRAVDRTTGDQVAVKLLREDLVRQPKLVTRFVQERAILLMLRHEHIVRVRDLLTVGESLGLVMDLVDGGSLRGYLHEHGSLPPAEAARVLGQVAAALAEAHRLGVVHRDLKPDNILVHQDGDRLHTKLTDFGIARVLNTPGMTTPGALMGTPNYLAPESINGTPPGPAGDVYALGILFYELIVGRPPFSAGPAASVLRRHIEEEPHRYPEIPAGAWSVIAACMDKDPARRPSAESLVATLDELVGTLDGVPALDLPEPTPALPHLDDDEEHPSALPYPAPPPRKPHNRVATWRWARPGVLLAVAATAAVALGVPALGPWHLLDSAPPHHPPAAASPAARTPGAAPQAKPSVRPDAQPSAAPDAAPEAGITVSAGAAKVAAGARLFGPYLCTTDYSYDPGHPVRTKPCYATGAGIRLIGHMQAVPGVQADISLSLQDVETGDTIAGPYTCAGMMFTDFEPERDCGPFDLDAPHGHRYVVVESWVYTGRSMLPGGRTRGPEFSW